jgi:iron complex transport system substrate-binding protein
MNRVLREVAALALGLVGLSAGAAGGDPGPPGYPLTIENCGTQVHIAAPPARVVALKSTSVEMLLALGLADRIVGVGFVDGPVPAQWAAAARGLRVLSDKLPSAEVVLGVAPDFVYAGWESSFSADGAGERQMLQALGVATYVSPAACRLPGFQPKHLGFPDLFAQIEEIGRIFDRADAAAALVAAEKAELAAIVPDPRGLTSLWYSSGTRVPYVGGGGGAPEMIMRAAGLGNIMAGMDDSWISASWESIAAADPDVIVLVDADWNSVAQKKQLLSQNPITRMLSAVQNERYLTIPFPASEAGVRSVDAARDLADQLRALRF